MIRWHGRNQIVRSILRSLFATFFVATLSTHAVLGHALEQDVYPIIYRPGTLWTEGGHRLAFTMFQVTHREGNVFRFYRLDKHGEQIEGKTIPFGEIKRIEFLHPESISSFHQPVVVILERTEEKLTGFTYSSDAFILHSEDYRMPSTYSRFQIAAIDFSVRLPSAETQTLSHWSMKGDLDKVKALLAQGADINARDRRGYSPLLLAARASHSATADYAALVRILLENGADVNARNYVGWTALHLAAMGGRAEIVRILLENGARVNAKDDKGNTALHYAKQHAETVRILLEHGAE